MDINTLPTASQAGVANKSLVAQASSKAVSNASSDQNDNKAQIDDNALAQASGRRGSLLDISV